MIYYFLKLFYSIIITNFIYIFLGSLFYQSKHTNLKYISSSSIFGFIILSFLALLINFFLPLSIFVNTCLLIIIIIMYFRFNKIIKKNEIIFLIVSSLICLTLIIFDNVNTPDGGLYHLPFTKIINNEKIIFGLSNLHHRFGHVSIMQYVSAVNLNHLTGDIGILIPLASIYSFIVLYFIFDVFINITRQNTNCLSLIFSIYVLVFIGYKVNRYSGFGNDAIGHIFYFYVISYIFNLNYINNINFNKISLISVFTILNKFTLIFTVLVPIYLFFKRKISLKKSLISLAFVFLVMWFVKNIFVSGCLLYPEIKTCFQNLEWTNKPQIINEKLSGEVWAKDWPNRGNKNITMEVYLKKFNWFSTWYQNHFMKILKIILPFIIILIILNLFISKKKSNIRIFKNNNQKKYFFITIFISLIGLIMFFFKFPLFRYGYSYLISFIILISILFQIKYVNIKTLKVISKYILIIFTVILCLKQLQRYLNYYNERTLIPNIYSENNFYDKKFLSEKFYFNQSLNQHCWYNVNLCTHYKINNVNLINKLGYYILTVK